MVSSKYIVAIGSDHAGFEYKQQILKVLEKKKVNYIDYGPNNNLSVDYPDFAHPVGKIVNVGKATFGIVICGSGNGVCMTVNKYKNVRGALCWNKELTKLARTHNDANVLCIPARFISLSMARSMVKIFLETEFEGGRHANRVNKI
ncbi:MAG: ribose 5-phosphate isomerase B [Saprospiraceae bacterium]|nr:ribose 5-phosphate isomerase B [Saprospiraceae bacterium]MBK9041840.1 ribose 5-phosphate isomerase B [Saprospiraceae bacterium]